MTFRSGRSYHVAMRWIISGLCFGMVAGEVFFSGAGGIMPGLIGIIVGGAAFIVFTEWKLWRKWGRR